MVKFFRRVPGTLNWTLDEEELGWYAVNIATLWLRREYEQKGHVTADQLGKACGILSEEIFDAELNELNVPHLRTVPLLNKEHPTNLGKPYDCKIQDSTIDIKSISPLPPPSGHHQNLNLNKNEIENNGLCDYYICTKCYPEMPFESKYPDELPRQFALKVLKRVQKVEFLGYATGAEMLKARLVVPKDPNKSPFYSKSPPHHPIAELALKLSIPLEQLGA